MAATLTAPADVVTEPGAPDLVAFPAVVALPVVAASTVPDTHTRAPTYKSSQLTLGFRLEKVVEFIANLSVM